MLDGMPHEQFNELFKKLPENLQDAIYAEETGQNAEAICERNKIPELFGFLIDRILSVYLGILPLEKFLEGIGQKIEGKPGAKQILYEIDRFLILPYKEAITQLYAKTEEAKPAGEPVQ
jgi:hypothetical protein